MNGVIIMTQNEFGVLVKGMKAVYPQDKFIPDDDAFMVWFSLLKDLPYELVNIAIQKHMMQEKFPPTIADIREKAASLEKKNSDDLNESEAWNLVWKAICNSTYNSEEEFAKLPPDIQKAVGSPGNLRSCAIDEEFNMGVESSNFKRNYRNILEEKKRESKLPERLQNNRLKNNETGKIGVDEDGNRG